MKAVAFRENLPVDRTDCLVDIELMPPGAHGRDLLVPIEAVSVNPVDAKVRRNSPPPDDQWRVPDWDAAGDLTRQGSNAQYRRWVGARRVDAGCLRNTRGEHFDAIDSANLRRANALLESDRARGKIVLEGF